MKKKELVYSSKGLYCDLDKKGMIVTGFTQVDNNTMKELCIDFHPNVSIVYFMLISHRHGKKDENYNQCFPTKDLLCKETGLSKDTIIKCIKTLADNDYILYRKGNSQYANQYFFPLEEFYKGEGDYLLNIAEDIIDDEEVPTNDDNKESFTPIGKYVNEIDNDDIFDDILPPVNSSDGCVNVFYDNMVKYYDITDETLANNNYIDKKVNSLIGYVQKELVKNDITDITADKVVIDILKGNRRSFTTSLSGKNFPKQFNKYTYIISCIQSNFTKKKLPALIKKHSKVETVVNNVVDDNLAESMNDFYADSDDWKFNNQDNIIDIKDKFPIAEEEFFFNKDAEKQWKELFG
ncbi:MAG: helix-turn-helix domain-containing protein [Bacilli bacterium]|nr:helix-turn-helix domain-containing protein [Bacilli bacterium]